MLTNCLSFVIIIKYMTTSEMPGTDLDPTVLRPHVPEEAASKHALKRAEPPLPLVGALELSSNRIRFRDLAVGVGLGAAALTGVAMEATGHLDVGSTIISLAPNQAQPSTALSTVLDIGVDAGASLGAGLLVWRSGKLIRRSGSPRMQAIHTMAHAKAPKAGEKPNTTFKVRRAAAGVGAIALVSGLSIGNFWEIGRSAGNSESSVGILLDKMLTKAGTGQGENFLISTSPYPELANNSSMPHGPTHRMQIAAAKQGITLLPERSEWHKVLLPSGYHQEVVVFGIPPKYTGLPLSDASCSNVKTIVSKDLGVPTTGDTVNIDGLPTTVADVFSTNSGAGLLPIIMNNNDMVRCLDNNPQQAFSGILARGNKQELADLLQTQGLSSTNIANRAYIVPLEQFLQNTQRSNKEMVYPYVLDAIGLGLILGSCALSLLSRTKIKERQRTNAALVANGTSLRTIAAIEGEKAESSAIKTAFIASALLPIVEYFENSGISGSDMGVALKTALFVLGGTWFSLRTGSAVALRKEAKSINSGEEQIL